MVLNSIPLTAGIQNEYTVLVVNEDKIFTVGDEVTLKIYFYNKDIPVDADDINITIGMVQSPIRFIEVNVASAKIATGVYEVTFTIEDGDMSYGIQGTVKCMISEGRGEVSATWGFQLFTNDIAEGIFAVAVMPEKPRFTTETVTFGVIFTNNSEKVDPESIQATLTVNGVGQSVTLSQETRGVGEYQYDYEPPQNTESLEVDLNVLAMYENKWAESHVESRRDHYQVWLNTLTQTKTEFTGKIGVCDLDGAPVVADVIVDYSFKNETNAKIMKQVSGRTSADGLLDITLDYSDLSTGFDRNIEVIIWANGSSTRAENYQQWSKWAFDPTSNSPNQNGFDVITEDNVIGLEKNTQVSLRFQAFLNGTPLANKDIYSYIFTHMWSVGATFGYKGEMGQVQTPQMKTTDENGYFTLTFTTPNRSTVLELMFKADVSGTRNDGEWKRTFQFVNVGVNFMYDDAMDIAVQNFGLGQSATVTATSSGTDGGAGGIGVIPIEPGLSEDEIRDILFMEMMPWDRFDAVELDVEETFTGDTFTRDIGVPGFFPDDMNYLIIATMWVDAPGTRGDRRERDRDRDHKARFGRKVVDRDGEDVEPVVVPKDTTPPEINHTAITIAKQDDPITVYATVTDEGDGVQEVVLHYRTIGDQNYTAITMPFNGEIYITDIPDYRVTLDGIEYYISATDGTNTVTDPADTDQPHAITDITKEEVDEGGGGFLPGFGLILVFSALAMGAFLQGRQRKRRL